MAQNVIIRREVDGVEMGVLDDGTPFLTNRGLARLCGVAPSAAITQAQNWVQGKRTGKLAQMLVNAGYDGPIYETITISGKPAYAFPDHVCMVFLEYYAFESSPVSEQALVNYRLMARKSLRDFIYLATGYDPNNSVPPRLRQFHDRLMTNVVPRGYFSVFREMSAMVIEAIQVGLEVDHQTIPDISVGKTWSTHWDKMGYEATFGKRIHYEHNYPEYFPQSASNPQPSWAYPLSSLGEFRKWLQDEYLIKKFPKYLQSKVKTGQLAARTAELMLSAMLPDEAIPEEDE